MRWKRVPDGSGCNVETPSAELCSCRRDKRVVAFCRTKICPTRNAGDWDADVVTLVAFVGLQDADQPNCRFYSDAPQNPLSLGEK